MNNQKKLEEFTCHISKLRQLTADLLIPKEAKTHFHRAEKEVLLGLKSILDRTISRMEQEEQHDTTKTKGKKTMSIEIIDDNEKMKKGDED